MPPPVIAAGVEAAAAIFGAIQGSNAQRQAGATAGGENAATLGLAQQLAKAPYLQPILNAEKSGVATLKNDIGGVPNIGALSKELLGGNIEQAIQAALSQRSGNLATAAGITGRLGENATQVAQSFGNPWAQVPGAIGGLINPGTNPQQTTGQPGNYLPPGYMPQTPDPGGLNYDPFGVGGSVVTGPGGTGSPASQPQGQPLSNTWGGPGPRQ